MRQSFRFAKHAQVLLCAGLMSASVHASMVELEDSELSDVTGQAFINLSTDSHSGLNFTKIDFGVKVETQMNIKKLELGNYSRSGETMPADLSINNFALGTVGPNDTINPFLINNPYLELAYNGNRVVGVRIGFGEAQGFLSGDINSFTGNLAIDIYGKGSYLGDKITCGWDFIVCLPAKGLVSGVWADEEFKAQATLVNGQGGADPVRATKAGLVNGTQLAMPDNSQFANFLLGLFTSQNCNLLGVTTCFNLADYKTLPVGKFDTNTNQFLDTSKGVFISLQTENVPWRDQQNAGQFINALAGAFMNMPRNADGSGAVTLSFQQALEGILRRDTCLGSAVSGC
ncbi:hypothetical protein DFO61_5169 [Ectopseudomonas oleovorans]|jgi:hypothetical protein|uniref:DUF6160 domain-containing protein n=3 Tax=Pseudomonadaceae TaxID=135621 RepID=A0A397M4P8_ECTOL|nr:DUF6160 family protein [Pseudomonas berkeleyensis]ALN18115.1 hypothetical protein DW68_005595 [Pseudomonas mendocina S5.2]KES01055.1 hypothetical protein HN51_14685 [Pseudomonas mendocina]RIA17797.1 hypothetical protein DFO61_5169 [Pseudomonas oleovorans]QMV62414.1 hypothetical protein HS968_20615 [Pseudomonas berkeleyensis]WSO37858.1 DUF6160 family protein [Pseudomonas berkeleyensis]